MAFYLLGGSCILVISINLPEKNIFGGYNLSQSIHVVLLMPSRNVASELEQWTQVPGHARHLLNGTARDAAHIIS